MNLTDQAMRIARATRSNPAAVQQIRTEYASLALLLATSDDAGKEITSATVNGQSFTASVTMTKSDRFALLDKIVFFYDNGIKTSRRSIVAFRNL